MAATATQTDTALDLSIRRTWPLALGFGVLAIPTIFSLGDQFWSKEIGAHGPIIAATGIWLLWREMPAMRRQGVAGDGLLTALLLIPSVALYVFGRAYDFLSLEAAGLYGVGLAILQSKFGVKQMSRKWFPLLYLGFSIPPPTWVIDALTGSLKKFVTFVATDTLHAVGIPVAREGVTIFVAQYQLLVEDACSGMHSIVGLIAISLLYVYLMHGSSWRYSVLFVLLSIPIAIVANILRIMTLVLLTYFCGNEVAQGFLHFAAGIFLFAVALVLLFAIDKSISYVRERTRTRP